MEVNQKMHQSDEKRDIWDELASESESAMVTVVCGEDTYFIPINKLTDQSQFFARALEVPMVEKKERKVVVKDIDGSIFEKVIKFIMERSFHFNVETEASEALEAADRLDMKDLKEEVCNKIKDMLDTENVKAVLSVAERFSAKQLFKAAFDFMQEYDVKLDMEDVVENPNLALAFMEECRVTMVNMKEELAEQEEVLDEKERLLEMYRRPGEDNFFQCRNIYYRARENWIKGTYL